MLGEKAVMLSEHGVNGMTQLVCERCDICCSAWELISTQGVGQEQLLSKKHRRVSPCALHYPGGPRQKHALRILPALAINSRKALNTSEAPSSNE